jgi:uncharacterized protein YaiI (UPF0178 family)
VQEPEMPNTCKILLDECVTRRLDAAIKNEGFKVNHSVEIVGWGAKDDAIKEYAKQSGYVLVTRDFGLACQCLDQNVKMAFYYKGKAYVLEVQSILPLGEDRSTGAPIKFKKAKQKRRLSLFARIKNKLVLQTT